MFPNHSLETITRIYGEMNGDSENTISILLGMPDEPRSPPPPSAPRNQNYPPQQVNHPPQGNYPPSSVPPSYGDNFMNVGMFAPPSMPQNIPAQPHPQPQAPRPNPQPNPAPQLSLNHIFKPDFLRWPIDAQVVKVGIDGNHAQQQQPSFANPFGGNSGVPPQNYMYPSPNQGMSGPMYFNPNIPPVDPNDDASTNISIDSNLLGGGQNEATPDKWSRFKSFFSSSNTYNKI